MMWTSDYLMHQTDENVPTFMREGAVCKFLIQHFLVPTRAWVGRGRPTWEKIPITIIFFKCPFIIFVKMLDSKKNRNEILLDSQNSEHWFIKDQWP